ncbi:MAG: hypothetical protein MK180_12175 [Rhodobacteraceae bacterium]|nr:hypothetical protein [Paracoccaceae bacterium]
MSEDRDQLSPSQAARADLARLGKWFLGGLSLGAVFIVLSVVAHGAFLILWFLVVSVLFARLILWGWRCVFSMKARVELVGERGRNFGFFATVFAPFQTNSGLFAIGLALPIYVGFFGLSVFGR